MRLRFGLTSVISLTPFEIRTFASFNIFSGALECSDPRVYGTTQKLQNLSHPS